jgi:hypothetical protein
MDTLANRQRLAALEEMLIGELVRAPTGIREGVVMTQGPVPYRRLDCDGRALAYVRRRPRKDFVRIDISGLWIAPKHTRLELAGASGVASLAVRSEEECRDAIDLIRTAVAKTRAERERREAGEAKVTVSIALAPKPLAIIPRSPHDDGDTPTDRAA